MSFSEGQNLYIFLLIIFFSLVAELSPSRQKYVFRWSIELLSVSKDQSLSLLNHTVESAFGYFLKVLAGLKPLDFLLNAEGHEFALSYRWCRQRKYYGWVG
jgi:hypothetical protein